MDKEELAQKMIEFADTQDGDMFDEWYATAREVATAVLTDFAKHIGVEVAIPDYVPVKTRQEVNLEKQRKEIFREMLPELEKLFNLRYKEITEKNRG